MKFSCATFFFALTIAAQLQRIHTAVSDELVQYKQTLDEATDALRNAEETSALSGNAELQRQRRKSIDELLRNSEFDLNLNLEREALDLDRDMTHPLQGRDAKQENKNNKEDAKKLNVNDQLNDLVQTNSNFQNVHRKLLNSFHNSQKNINLDEILQKQRNSEVKEPKDSKTSSGTNKEGKEKNTGKEKETIDSNSSNKNNQNKNSNTGAGNTNKDSYLTNNNWKSSLSDKDKDFNLDMDFGKTGSFNAPYSPTYTKFDTDSFDTNTKGSHKSGGDGSSVLTKAYISCKPLSSNAGHSKSDKAYFEFTSNLNNPTPSKPSSPKSNLNTFLLLEANNYRNALHSKQWDNMEEFKEKKVDPEMRKMMEKVDFPHFKLDFDTQMEDFARSKTRTDAEEEDEPISYEKTIENIHFPSIVNDQFDLGRNDLSHEADYKLSKIEQEQSEPRKGQIHANAGLTGLPSYKSKMIAPSKRSTGFNAMDEIKLKTSTRLMAKGLGPSLPSYALSETQQELQLDDAVKKLEKSFRSENPHIGIGDYSDRRATSRLSKDELDWQDRLRHLEEAEERSYEKLFNDVEPQAQAAGDSDAKTKTDDVILGPTYTVLRRRRTSAQPDEEEEQSNLFDLLRTKRVTKNPRDDGNLNLKNVRKLSPNEILLANAPDFAPVSGSKGLIDEVPASEVSDEEPTDEEALVDDADDDEEPIIDLDNAQLVDDNEPLNGENIVRAQTKRCGEQEGDSKTAEDKSTRESDTDVKHKLSIFKFKRDSNKDDESNGPKRRVKRIGVLNTEGKMTAVKEVDLDGLLDLMTLNNYTPQREKGENEGGSGAEKEKRVAETSGVQKMTEKADSKQKILRRRRREVDVARKEVYNDESLHVLNGSERMRRSVNGKDKRRLKREAQAEKSSKESEEKKDKEKTNGSVETQKNKPIDDDKDTAKKLTPSEVKAESIAEHLMDKRNTQAVDPIDDNNGDNHKAFNTASLINDDGNLIPTDAFERRMLTPRTETLNDAAVIAADRKAMNAARASYTRNAERAGNYIDAREDNYGDLMERLRRLSLRNREPERQSDFSNSASEFGYQKFDNLKQFDQNARNFDGTPIDNLWYGNDPWEEEQDSNNQQSSNEETKNRNRPNKQHEALTIRIEDGAIKSIERKEQPSKNSEVGMVSEKMANAEEEEVGGSDDAAFGWFGKSKNKEDASCKGEDNGLVLQLNNQMLNCTAFNTLESFLKSVQQQQNRGDGGKSGGHSSSGGGNASNGASNAHSNNRIANGNCENKQGGHNVHGAGGEQGNGGHGGGDNRHDGNAGGAQDKFGHGGYGDRMNGNHGAAKHDGSNAGNFGFPGNGNGLGPAGDSCGTKSTDGNTSGGSTYNDAINMTIEIQPVTMRPLGSSGQKAMKLNITINASVMGDQKAKNFFGNGTFKVQSEDRERRGVSFPQFEAFKRYATKRKCAKPKVSCDEGKANGKGSLEIVKSIFNMAKCNPQMKPLWAILKRNQQCMKKQPPQENTFEKMQKDDVNHIEDMVQQAMEAISDIIDDQVEQRSCIPLPPELRIFYDQILDVFESNSAEGVREKRANIDAPFDEFSKEVRLIDPNSVEERSRIVKKLLRQYEGLPLEDQQQMVGVRDNLLWNLNMLQQMQTEQTHKKREPQKQQPQQAEPLQPQQAEPLQPEQQPRQEPEQEPQHQPDAVQVRQEHKDASAEVESDMQARQSREVLKRLEAEKDVDEQVIKTFNLPYTPEYVRLIKASELLQEQDQRESARKK